MSTVTTTRDEKFVSKASEAPEIFDSYPDVLYYGIFLGKGVQNFLFCKCDENLHGLIPFTRPIPILNPHVTLAHRGNSESPSDEVFIRDFYERDINVDIIGFCCDSKVVVALVDPKTCPISQSQPPHITLYRNGPVDLKVTATECIARPLHSVAVKWKIRGQVRSWSRPLLP